MYLREPDTLPAGNSAFIFVFAFVFVLDEIDRPDNETGLSFIIGIKHSLA